MALELIKEFDFLFFFRGNRDILQETFNQIDELPIFRHL